MKKTIAILLVLVIGMVGVWAANNSLTDLVINSTVGGKYGVKVSLDDITGTTVADKQASFNSLTNVPLVTFTEGSKSKNLYVSFMSNLRNKATVTTTMNPLVPSDTSITTKIGYVVLKSGETTGATVYTSSKDIAFTFIEENSSGDGLRVISQGFNVSVIEADWNLAAAGGDYTTTWTIELKIN